MYTIGCFFCASDSSYEDKNHQITVTLNTGAYCPVKTMLPFDFQPKLDRTLLYDNKIHPWPTWKEKSTFTTCLPLTSKFCSLYHLKKQLKTYCQGFPCNTSVCGENHVCPLHHTKYWQPTACRGGVM